METPDAFRPDSDEDSIVDKSRIAEGPLDWDENWPGWDDEPEGVGSDWFPPGRAKAVPPLRLEEVPYSSISELFYITPLPNLPSILERGILSHNRAAGVPHVSVADPGINKNRGRIRFRDNATVHDCANLYFNAQNAMLYRVLLEARERGNGDVICVIGVSNRVLWLAKDVLDGNAAVAHTRKVEASVPGHVMIDRSRVHRTSWYHADKSVADEYERCMMAEVLIRETVPPQYIERVYFRSDAERNQGVELVETPRVQFVVRPGMFFGRALM